MIPLFVIGRVRRDANGVIVLSDETHPRPIIDPAPVLDCSLWQTVVPEIYALDAERAIRAVGPEFEGIKGTLDVIPRFVECLRRWIGSNVEPRGRFGYSYPIGEP